MAPSKTKTTTKKKTPVKKPVSKKKAPAKSVAKKVATKKAPVKKVPAKARAKKATPKKVAKKAPTKKAAVRKKKLPVAEGDHRFWVMYDGPVLTSLRDLSVWVVKLSKDQYEYHAFGAQNDFALWVRYVLRDAHCAKEIEKATTRRALKTCVDAALIRYQ